MMGLGMPELLIIGLIIVILFGAKRIPDLAKGLGEGIRNFKTGMNPDDAPKLEIRKEKKKKKPCNIFAPSSFDGYFEKLPVGHSS
jgi:sec-independent protein translocase protein TatA